MLDLLNVQLNILAANRLLLRQPFREAHGALVFNETVTLSELVSSKHLEAAVGVVLKNEAFACGIRNARLLCTQ